MAPKKPHSAPQPFKITLFSQALSLTTLSLTTPTFTALSLAVALFHLPQAYAAESYALACKGGPDAYTYQVSAGVYGGVDGHRMALYTNFKPAIGSVGNGLQAGECAWFDRPMRIDEPGRMVMEGASISNFYIRFKPTWGNRIDGEAGTYSPNPQLRYMGHLMDPAMTVVFCVRSLLPSNKALLISTWGLAGHRCN